MKWTKNWQPVFKPIRLYKQSVNDNEAFFVKYNKNYKLINIVNNPFKKTHKIIDEYFSYNNLQERICNNERNKARAIKTKLLLQVNLTIESLLEYFINCNNYIIENWEIEEVNGKYYCSIIGKELIYRN